MLAFFLKTPSRFGLKKAAYNVSEAVRILIRFFSPKPQPGTAAATASDVTAWYAHPRYAPAKRLWDF
jgi:hypothetical protein